MTPFVGIGTGRCGTVSLAKVVAACGNTSVTHEAYLSPWYKRNEKIDLMCDVLNRSREQGVLAGDVASHHLPHVEYIRSKVPGVKLVCLHRDRADVVESFYRWWQGSLVWPRGKGRDPEWSARFPAIDAHDARQSIEFYYEMYEEWAACLAEPILHLPMTDLNDDDGVRRLFDFLEIADNERNYDVARHWNSYREMRHQVLNQLAGSFVVNVM